MTVATASVSRGGNTTRSSSICSRIDRTIADPHRPLRTATMPLLSVL
jgi:hypothetical protein